MDKTTETQVDTTLKEGGVRDMIFTKRVANMVANRYGNAADYFQENRYNVDRESDYRRVSL